MMNCADKETATVVQEADGRPGWSRFCEDVLGKVEMRLMMYLETARAELDTASAKEAIMVWHFAFTQDARNYLVYTMVDTLFGFARHGEAMRAMVEDQRFLSFVQFVMKEEHMSFLQAESKEDYFRTLTNRMLRLSKMVHYLQAGDDSQNVPDDVVPADPVDALFEFYPPDGREAPEQASAEETLKTLAVRMELARLDEEKDKGNLSAIQARKECHANLRRFEKRLEKLALLVKGMTQQMLYNPEIGEAEVVSLFGRHLFFLAHTDSKRSVINFLALQKTLSQQVSRDRADAQACLQCSDFVPLVKESTCMPESLLSHIEQKCRQQEVQQQQQQDSPQPAGETQAQPTTGGEDQTSNPASDSQKPEQEMKKAAEDSASTKDLSKSLEGVKLDPESNPKSPSAQEGRSTAEMLKDKTRAVADPPSLAAVTSPSKLVMEARKYFTDVKNLDGALQHCGGRCIFTIRSNKSVDYFCPVLGYLPLLPVLKVLTIRPEGKVDERKV